MDIPIDKIKTEAGDRIVDSIAFDVYRVFAEGHREEARKALIEAHYDFYFGPRLVITTDEIVAEVYRRRGIPKPTSYLDSDPEFVREAVKRHSASIGSQTLATEVTLTVKPDDKFREVEIDEVVVKVYICKNS